MATAYTSDSMRQLFQSPFHLTDWYSFLQHFLNATELKATPERIIGSPTDNGYYLGCIDTTDSYRIGLFHYPIAHGSVVNKRVGLRNLVKSFINPTWGEFDAALVVFDSGDHWRLSFICDIKGEATSPKRYTYVFGSHELLYKTPIERFRFLQNKGISFENLKTAFSVEALSDEFFDKYREQYADFIQYVTGKRFVKVGNKWQEKVLGSPNASLMRAFGHNEKKIRDYVKKMMGRITFLHFLQRKGWMCGDLNYMQNLFEHSPYQHNFLDAVLEPLFFGILNTPPTQRAALFADYGWDSSLLHEWQDIPYLNGGLFERDEEDEPESRFPAEYFKRLFQFFSEYNFTIDENDPNDAEIGVDPEMLGKIFENLLEDNKDKGAFYTPKEIVRYMCQESLIAYLETNTSIVNEKLRNFVLSPEEGAAYIPDSQKARLLRALEEVKICDPAIGSGAFPMGLLNELLHCREALNGEHNNRAEIKKSIIQNNIYGVDIEKGAVDIARLRFWLSIVVDEETPAPLPNFDYKIMQGNSLIESFKGVDLSQLAYEKNSKKDNNELSLFDDEKNHLQKTVSHLLSTYYSCSDHDRKMKLQQEIANTINQQLSAQSYDSAILQELQTINLAENDQFFLWHTWFSDVFSREEGKDGFDIVIGNPPYGAKYDDHTKQYYKNAYATARTIRGLQKGSLDTYTLFIELGYNLLRKNGSFAYIVPISLTSSDSLTGIHRMLIDNCGTIHISSYAVRPKPVFENAVVNTSILLFQKTETPCKHLYSTKMYRRGNEFSLQKLIDNLNFVDVNGYTLNGRIPKIGCEVEKSILSKILKHTPIKTYYDNKGKPIYYRTTGGRYFKVVTNYPTGSTKEKPLFFKKSLADSIACVLSSSLSFWFYQIYSNNLDWKTYEIENFTIPIFSTKNLEFLETLYSRYLADIETNANTRTTSGKSTYNVDLFKEYKIVRSKTIIDEIDDYICPLYGLTQEETEFIKNYELEFRLAGE